MTISRFAVGAAVALFSALPSMDPSVRAADPLPPRPVIGAEPSRAPAALADAPVIATEEPAPPDVVVEINGTGSGVHHVVLRRGGYLVALMHGSARSSGADSASMRVEVADRSSPAESKRHARGDEEIDRFLWETTAPGTLTTTRGVVSLRLDGAELVARLSLAAPPERVAEVKGAHHQCVAHRDEHQGFIVLCKLPRRARRASAVNVTGPRFTEGAAAMTPKDGDPLVRLDLPLAPSIAEARVVGFSVGRTGVVIRAEASWIEGEAPSLVVDEAARDQPLSPNFN